MTTTLKRFFISTAIATSCLGSFSTLRAQTGPTFRSRSDVNAERDLQRLREELNKATDAKGPINPLGAFLQRDAEPHKQAGTKEANESALLEIGPSARNQEQDSEKDTESEQPPRLDPSAPPRQRVPALAPNPIRSNGVLPGPRYTIIQQASPQFRVVDGFRPARFVSDIEATVRPSLEYPVTFASANLPVVGQPTNVVSNLQEIPFGATPNNTTPFNPGVGFNPGGIPSTPQNILPNNNGAILPGATNPLPGQLNDANIPPSLPYNPAINSPVPGTTFSTPIPSGNAPAITNPAPYMAPPPTYYPGAPTPGPGYNAAPLANSNNNVMPNYSRTAPIVNGAPFVSSQPCQFDARYMVSREAYRQCADPCAPRGSPYAPYAPQPGGLSYVPQTGMAYNNNGYDSGYRPLIGFGQTLENAYLGRGIVGQPTAYVDGQPIRNFIRYLFP